MKDLQLIESARLLESFDDVAVVFHKKPDGDALGSALALCLGLQQLNRRCKILNFEPIPKRFEFLFKGLSFEEFDHKNVVAVDLASFRLLDDELNGIKINLLIDHHLNSDVDADFALIDCTAAATCELIYKLLKLLNVKFNKWIALCLYVGLVTDTGCFKFSNTTSLTHKIAADLFGYGVDFSSVNLELFDIKTMPQIELQLEAYKNLQFFFGGRCACVFITQAILSSCGCVESDFFVVVDLVRCVQGVMFAVCAKEVSNECFKFSVRAVGTGPSAASFCERFGGGGHEKAAGFEIRGDLSSVKLKVLNSLEDFFRIEGYSMC